MEWWGDFVAEIVAIDWAPMWAAFVGGAVPSAVAVWLALSERRRLDHLRQQDLIDARDRAVEENMRRRREAEREQSARRREARDARRQAVVERLTGQLRTMSLTKGGSEVQQQAEIFTFLATSLYLGEHHDEESHLRLWVNEVALRYLELSDLEVPQNPRASWMLETDDRTIFLANAARRLQIWSAPYVEASHLRDDFARLLTSAGIPAHVSMNWVSPWVQSNPVEPP